MWASTSVLRGALHRLDGDRARSHDPTRRMRSDEADSLTVCDLIASHPMLKRRREPMEWAARYGTDVRRAWQECDHPQWLNAIARGLGATRAEIDAACDAARGPERHAERDVPLRVLAQQWFEAKVPDAERDAMHAELRRRTAEEQLPGHFDRYRAALDIEELIARSRARSLRARW